MVKNLPVMQDVGGTCGFYRMMHGSVSDPSFCAFVHRVAFEEVSGCEGKLGVALESLQGLRDLT